MKSEPSRGGNDSWLVQVDSNFQIVWEKTIGGADADVLVSAVQGHSGVVYLGGYTSSPAGVGERQSPFRGGSDLWFIKLVPDQPLAPDNTNLTGSHPRSGNRLSFRPTIR